jgi:hypothetical protein
LTDVLFPGLRSVGNTLAREDGLTSSEIIFIGVLVFYSLTASHQASSQIGLNALSAGNREAMVWVRRNTRPESGFLVLTGARSAVCDPVSEWFPAFAERKSLVTVQGTEWRLGEDFGAFLRHAREVQECLYGSIGCLEAAALKYDLDPDYLYISKRLVADDCKPLVPPPDFNYFLDSLRADPHYRSVYDTDSVVIYQLQ